jgi:hypothetical protein
MKLVGMMFQPNIKSDDNKDRIFVGFSFKNDQGNFENVGFATAIDQSAEQILKNLKLFAESIEKQFIEKGYINGKIAS